MRVRMPEERSDLTGLVSAVIKTTFNTRSPGGVERCVDVLNQLKSLSLSVSDILLSESIFTLQTLKKHRHSKIRKEAQALFDSWHKTLNAQTKQNSFEVGLIKLRLKCKKPRLDQISMIDEAVTVKETTGFLKLKNREDEQRSQTHLTKKIKKETKNTSLVLMKKEDQRSLTHKDEEIEKKTYSLEPKKKQDERERLNDLKPQKVKRRDTPSEAVTTMKQLHVRATLKTNTEEGEVKKKKTEMAEKKKTEFLELFKVAKKAADMANAKGLLLGKAETSRCVEALSLLMRINITPQPRDSSQIMEKLNGLANHKDRKICNAASALLQLWKQRITNQQRKHSATKTFRTSSCKAR